MDTWPLDKLILELKKIKKLSFIKTTHAHQGGVGNTLETFLGIKENNFRTPDLGVIELKAKRTGSTSMLTLSSKSPLPRSVNKKLFDAYNKKGDDNVYRLYTTIYGSRKNNRGFRVKLVGNNLVLENPKKIHVYWPLEQIDDVLKQGNQKVVLVWAETKGKLGSKQERFYYNEAYLLSGISIGKLKQALNSGKLKVDIRIGADLTGKAAGKYHDHGTGFRISKNNYLELFDKYQKLI